jgi:hypothetical protein
MLVVVVISPTKIVPCDDVWVELSICVLWTEYIYHPYMDRHTAYITMAARTPAWCSMHVLPVTASRAACPGGNGGARRAEPDRAARGNGHPSMPFRNGGAIRPWLLGNWVSAGTCPGYARRPLLCDHVVHCGVFSGRREILFQRRDREPVNDLVTNRARHDTSLDLPGPAQARDVFFARCHLTCYR